MRWAESHGPRASQIHGLSIRVFRLPCDLSVDLSVSRNCPSQHPVDSRSPHSSVATIRYTDATQDPKRDPVFFLLIQIRVKGTVWLSCLFGFSQFGKLLNVPDSRLGFIWCILGLSLGRAPLVGIPRNDIVLMRHSKRHVLSSTCWTRRCTLVAWWTPTCSVFLLS